MKILICIDVLVERYNFFKKIAESLAKLGHDVDIITAKPSVFFAAKNDNFNVFFIKNCKNNLTKSFDISRSNCFLSQRISFKQAEHVYISTYNTLEKLNEQNKYDVFFLWNGFCSFHISMKDFAKNKNIKILFFETANISGKVFVDPEGVNADSSIYKNINILNEHKSDKDEFENWRKNYIENKLNFHTVPQAKSFKNLNYFYISDFLLAPFFNVPCSYVPSLQDIKSRILNLKQSYKYNNINLKNENYIFFPLQVSSDTQVLANSNIDIIEAIKIASKKAVENNLKLLIKPHPAENDRDFVKTIYQLKKEYGYYFVNNNTFQLINHAKEIITINSTVGLESQILGKPVTFLGRSFYAKLNEHHLANYINSYLIDIDPFSKKPVLEKSILRMLARC